MENGSIDLVWLIMALLLLSEICIALVNKYMEKVVKKLKL